MRLSLAGRGQFQWAFSNESVSSYYTRTHLWFFSSLPLVCAAVRCFFHCLAFIFAAMIQSPNIGGSGGGVASRVFLRACALRAYVCVCRARELCVRTQVKVVRSCMCINTVLLYTATRVTRRQLSAANTRLCRTVCVCACVLQCVCADSLWRCRRWVCGQHSGCL